MSICWFMLHMNNHRLCYHPQIKKKQKASEFCKEFSFPCPQNVRTWSLHDTGYCFYAFWWITLWDTSNINLWALEKIWMGKTAFLALQQQATAKTVKILYRILTLFLDFCDFFSTMTKYARIIRSAKAMRAVTTEAVAHVNNSPSSWCLNPSGWSWDPSYWLLDPSGQPSDPLSGP